MGHYGIGPIVFYDRPRIARDELVLAPGVLEAVERQVLEVAHHRGRLWASRQHVKRGLLLHGPPGTGKTLTVRYVLSAAADHTVMLLTGGALPLVRHAVGLARLLQPSLVVLEDVDLVAEERGMRPGFSNPVLYEGGELRTSRRPGTEWIVASETSDGVRRQGASQSAASLAW
jgi:SpoVK/Ycf46/Vps4 family AAA+-type ATPase